MNSDYLKSKTKQVSCKKCLGTGFVKCQKKKIYCFTCNENKRCYKCENIPRLGIYDYCKHCHGMGYTEIKISKKSL